MKTIALFGASGRTGSHFLSQALDKGYEIKALVRTPEKIKLKHEKLTVFEGDVLSSEDVDLVVKGADIVVSLFGRVKNSPALLQTNGTKNIVESMKSHGVEKIISLSGGGLPFPEKDQPKFIDKTIRFMMKVLVPKVLEDAIAHHKVLETSGLKWMVARGPRLTDDAPKGEFKETWVGVDSGTKISRADLAQFILKEVEEENYWYQMPFISY